jgi:hypothetical protein
MISRKIKENSQKKIKSINKRYDHDQSDALRNLKNKTENKKYNENEVSMTKSVVNPHNRNFDVLLGMNSNAYQNQQNILNMTQSHNNYYSPHDMNRSYIPTPHVPPSLPQQNQFMVPYSCNNCEDIYKNSIFNNIPLNVMKCLFCNNVINNVALDFYLNKYKEELIQKRLSMLKIREEKPKNNKKIEKNPKKDKDELKKQEINRNTLKVEKIENNRNLANNESERENLKNENAQISEAWIGWIDVRNKQVKSDKTENPKKEEPLSELFKKKNQKFIENMEKRKIRQKSVHSPIKINHEIPEATEREEDGEVISPIIPVKLNKKQKEKLKKEEFSKRKAKQLEFANVTII